MFFRTRVRLRGHICPPGDKSVSHRRALLSAVAVGPSRLSNFATGDDCRSTLTLLQHLGTEAHREGDTVNIRGRGKLGFRTPVKALNAGNSGTTARLSAGFLAAQPFDSQLIGDESLSRRPLERVVAPLRRMGGRLETEKGHLPMTIYGNRNLKGIDYKMPVASSQVKSAILIAGLFAEGETRIRETVPTRDHTEIALQAMGAELQLEPGQVTVQGGVRLNGQDVVLPGDFSSAAFYIAAAAFLPDSEIVVERVGLNKTRTAMLDVLREMGANIEIETLDSVAGGEPIGRLVVRSAPLSGTVIHQERIPFLIDELPVLAVVGCFANGTMRVEGANELRVKESDRLNAIVEGLRAMGADVEAFSDGFEIRGGKSLQPCRLASYGDHRMVMAWAIASLALDGSCDIDDLEQVRISYPSFWTTLEQLVH